LKYEGFDWSSLGRPYWRPFLFFLFHETLAIALRHRKITASRGKIKFCRWDDPIGIPSSTRK